jgi:hypothetical protein
MTSRRSFLGLLCAAPVVVPVVAKAAMQEQFASGGYVRSIGGATNWGSGVAGNTTHRIKKAAAPDWKSADYKTLGDAWAAPTAWPPNRLFGSRLTPNGDAT